MGVLGVGKSTDGKYAQEAVGHNMTDVTKEKYTIYFAAQHILAAFVQTICTTV